MERGRRLTLRDFLYVAFKNRIAVATIFLAALVVSAIYCIVTPPVYRAETKLAMKLDRVGTPGIDQYRPDSYVILSSEGSQRIRHEIEILKGEYLTGKVLERLKGRMEPLRTGRTPVGQIADAMRNGFRTLLSVVGLSTGPSDPDKQMILCFLDALQVAHLKDTDIVSILFDWTDPRFAALVANTYADEYATQYALLDESQRLHTFYADQVALLGKRLKEAEDRYQGFLSSSNIADITLQKELLLRNIAELGDRINLTDIDIGQAQAKIKKIREMPRNRTELAETPGGLLDRTGMELSLSQSRKSDLLHQLSTEQKRLSGINAKTTMLAQLERERDIAELDYRNYRKGAEEARVSDDLEARKISHVKVAIPAIPPLVPFSPKKGLIILLAAIGGFLLGLAYSTVKEFFNHTFSSDRDVTDILDVPLLLSVPLQPHYGLSTGAKKGATNGGSIRLRRLFGQELRRPLAGNGNTVRNGSALVLCAALVIACFLQFSKTAAVSPYRFTMTRTLVPAREEGRPVSLSTIYPSGALNERDSTILLPAGTKSAEPELALLSDELEKQRQDLRKRRGETEAALRQVRPEG